MLDTDWMDCKSAPKEVYILLNITPRALLISDILQRGKDLLK